jgi:hypothetical protein
VPGNDLTYNLTVDRATGIFRGTFLHEDGTLTPYQGIIMQTVDRMGGFGYFLTATPSPIDHSGEAGEVLLSSP